MSPLIAVARHGLLTGSRTSTYTIGSRLADEIIEENGRTYHVYKDGSEYKKFQRGFVCPDANSGQNTCCLTMR